MKFIKKFKDLAKMNKKGGLFAYIFWILLGVGIGIYLTLKWFCK